MSYTIEQYRISERRACRLAGISRSNRRYQPVTDRGGGLRERIRELARERQRFGHLRLTVLLRREGWTANHKKGVSHLSRGAVAGSTSTTPPTTSQCTCGTASTGAAESELGHGLHARWPSRWSDAPHPHCY